MNTKNTDIIKDLTYTDENGKTRKIDATAANELLNSFSSKVDNDVESIQQQLREQKEAEEAAEAQKAEDSFNAFSKEEQEIIISLGIKRIKNKVSYLKKEILIEMEIMEYREKTNKGTKTNQKRIEELKKELFINEEWLLENAKEDEEKEQE